MKRYVPSTRRVLAEARGVTTQKTFFTVAAVKTSKSCMLLYLVILENAVTAILTINLATAIHDILNYPLHFCYCHIWDSTSLHVFLSTDDFVTCGSRYSLSSLPLLSFLHFPYTRICVQENQYKRSGCFSLTQARRIGGPLLHNLWIVFWAQQGTILASFLSTAQGGTSYAATR
jgi:hypothetical protein